MRKGLVDDPTDGFFSEFDSAHCFVAGALIWGEVIHKDTAEEDSSISLNSPIHTA